MKTEQKKTPTPTTQILAVALLVSITINCFAFITVPKLEFQIKELQEELQKIKPIESLQYYYNISKKVDVILLEEGFTVLTGKYWLRDLQEEPTQVLEANCTNWRDYALVFALSAKTLKSSLIVHKMFFWTTDSANKLQGKFIWFTDVLALDSKYYTIGIRKYVLCLNFEVKMR